MHEMPARKRARVEDKRVSNVRCATAQMASSPVGMYEYTEIKLIWLGCLQAYSYM